MRRCRFEAMWVLSHRERRGRKIEFDQRATVIRGANDTGKSVLIKSLFSCLGADPQTIHPKWESARASVLLRFLVDEKSFFILRHGNRFALFDEDRSLLGTYSTITSELALALAEVFDFRISLLNKQGERITPTPPFMVLPFYMDQDDGWRRNFASFGPLQQFSRWRSEYISYMVGIYPNEYYTLDQQIKKLERELIEPQSKLEGLSLIRTELGQRLAEVDFDVKIQEFREAVDSLLLECERLKDQQEAYRAKLQRLDSERLLLEAQLAIVKRAQAELTADYEFVAAELQDDVVACPTCGQEYENSLGERFAIARDEHRCLDLALEISEELISKERAILAERSALEDTKAEYDQVRALLTARQGRVTLEELIQTESRRELGKTLREKEDELSLRIGRLESDISAKRKAKAGLARAGSEKRTLVHEDYQGRMRRYLEKLSVENLPERQWSKIDNQIVETGSDLPRAALAYTMSMVHLVCQHGVSTLFPLVIDSPRQQEQDDENYLRMLEFIKEETPEDTQLILGLVDDFGVDFGGITLDLTEKYHALSLAAYSDVAEYVSAFEKCLTQ
jgi:hypothetical protein